MKFFIPILLLAAGASAFGTKGGAIFQRYEEQSAVAAAGEANPEPYSFSYSTGGGDASDTQTAQHFREETKDVHGVVVGKYGYVDPYGKLRVVHYRAGPEGYTVTGDVGPDQEVQRQQRELYSNDQSYQIQQQAWDSLRNTAPQASQAAVASTVHSSNAAQSNSEWTSVSSNSAEARESTLTEKYRTEAVHAPAAQIREQSFSTKTARLSAPAVVQHTKTVHAVKAPAAQIREQTFLTKTARLTAPSVVQHTQTVHSVKAPAAQIREQSSYSSSSSTATKTAAYTAPAVRQTSSFHQTAAIKSPSSQLRQYSYSSAYTAPAQAARVVKKVVTTTTSHQQSPQAARLIQSWNTRNFGNSAAYTSGVKGYSGAIKAAPAVYSGRLVSPARRGHTVVNFSQGGPVSYKYSYNF